MSIGETLRDERVRLGLGLDSLSKYTRISRKHLEAIEADRPEDCLAFFFYRSFVHQYADAVGLNPADFDAEIERRQPPAVSNLAPGSPEPFPLKAPDSIVSASNRIYLSSRSRVWGSATALVVVVIGCSGLYNSWRDHQAQATAPRQDNPPVAAKKAPAWEAAPSPAQPISAPLSMSSDDRIVVAVTSNEPVWISLSADGKPPVSGTLEPGQMRSLGSKDRVRLGVGSAGAVEVTLNGKSIGPIGLSGQVRVVVFTPKGFQILPPSGTVRSAPSDSPVDTGDR